MDAYVVIGDANSFKSSTVRALTGCRIRGVRELVQRGVVMNTFVQLSSLQEGSNWKSPKDFVREVRQSRANSVIVALRGLQHRRRPDANVYLDEFVRAGWNIKGVALLHCPSFNLTASVPPGALFRFPSGGQPHYYANELAARVRKKFGWA